MSINGIFNKYESYRFGFGYVDTIQRLRAVTSARNKVSTPNHHDRVTPGMQHAMRMRKALEGLQAVMVEPEEIQIVSPASASSVSNLGLDTTGTPATLQSTEEVNATQTSYSPAESEWSGSTAQLTISGEYDGSNGTGSLTFLVTTKGTHGQDDLVVKVYDPGNQQIDKINIRANDAIDQQYTLSNGLVLTLGEGDLLKNDTFTIDVNDSLPTSFSPTQSDWSGSSAGATISGEYDGSDGTGSLTFLVTKKGTHGQDDLVVKVYDPGNQQIDKINIRANDAIDQQYTLSNGLVLTLGEGDLLKNDAFAVAVFDSVGSTVDPDKPFSGTGNNNPNLEYGLSVTDGSFQINGTAIYVNASDSINTVLDRINQSDAGVTATFDTAAEKVLLTQQTPGSETGINITDDTSGFIAAVKLDQATLTPGKESEIEIPLAEVESFFSMQSGNIWVNGESIHIDINTDSLTDVLDRITASNAEVRASFDSSSLRVSLHSDTPDNQLILDSGITNFFSALGISDGTYNSLNDLIQAGGINVINAPDLTVEFTKTFSTESPNRSVETTSVAAPDMKMLGSLVNIIASSMNALFDDSSLTSSQTKKTTEIRNSIRSAISTAFDSEGPQYDTDFGLHFDFQNTGKGVFNLSQADRLQFENTLASPEAGAAVRSSLFGQNPSGLFNQLHAALTTAAPELDSEPGATGIFLDIIA